VIKNLCATKNSVYSKKPQTIDDLKMNVTEHIRNADRAILNNADRAILNSADRAILNNADRAILNNADRAILNNADRAVLHTVSENTVRCVNKCLDTGGGQFEHYL
jgi:tagatose-1,6-bisphosphate aldolase